MINRYLLRNILILNVFFMIVWIGENDIDIVTIVFKLSIFVFFVTYTYWATLTLKLKSHRKLRLIYKFLSSDIEFNSWMFHLIIDYLKRFILFVPILLLLFEHLEPDNITVSRYLYLLIVHYFPLFLFFDLFLYIKRDIN